MSAAPLTPHAEAPPVLSQALLERFDAPGPRYTSYPTADRFVETFGAADALRALAERAMGANLANGANGANGATVGEPAPL